jgi:hypothetical protein
MSPAKQRSATVARDERAGVGEHVVEAVELDLLVARLLALELGQRRDRTTEHHPRAHQPSAEVRRVEGRAPEAA